MAPGLSATLANLKLAVVEANSYVYVKMHTGDPGPNGTANPAPETTRKLVDWTTPTGGAMESAAEIEWPDLAAIQTWTHYSLWNASTGGTFGHSGTIAPRSWGVGDDAILPAGTVTMTYPLAT
ncbi:phage tail fiber protein [Pseudonocardia pini]|uniref:phage tail fiber protein n=1 Tax=Pseudonocardia pini TaxID=2758030 RepID=UPI0015F026CA|nr:hypothetical protein [Pseudonocardia pini]